MRSMTGRILVLGAVGLLTAVSTMNGSWGPGALGAEAQIGQLVFSTGINDRAEPTGDVGIEFPGDNDGVYVTFTFGDLPSGGSLGRIVRFNGEDFNYDGDVYGHLKCCATGGSGRFGFRIVKQSGNAGRLPGGAYDVRIYLNDAGVQHGGFGIRGTQGGDNGNDND